MFADYFYERRIIEDIHGDVYSIWEIYKIEELFNRHRQVCVFDNIDDFNSFKRNYIVEYKKYTERGMK